MQNGSSYDAIVIGGGPAGSTAAAALAAKGRRVVVLEIEKFPRYHIGESLLSYGYWTLERIGVLDRMKASHFVCKHSVQFVVTSGRASVPFYFSQQLAHEASATWQVLRSEFDQLLLDNARAKGAEVIEEITARELIQPNGAVKGVKAIDKGGTAREFHAPITIDATGRDAFAVTLNGWKLRDPVLNKIAVWTYYKGALRDPGIDEGATTVAYMPEKGWFWYIPLADDIVSVGVVAEKDYLYKNTRDLAAIFHGEVKKNAWIEKHLAAGRQFGPYRVTGEYSYRSRHCAADGLVLAADAVDAALAAGDASATRFAAYGAQVCDGIEAMRKLVNAFYNHAFSFRVFITELPHLKGDMTDGLIGNLTRDFQPLFDAVARFVAVPGRLPHGKPLAAGEAIELYT